jgi:hypothetical protein
MIKADPPDAVDASDPATVIGGGSIVMHMG